jgi:lysophospholipase L1-like esterase
LSSSLRGWLANLALATGSLLVVFLFLEIALRLGGFEPERHLATRRIVDAGWTRLLDCYPSNPRQYFQIDLNDPETRERYSSIAPHRFDAIARLHPWAVASRYNELRFRDVSPEPKAPGVYRIAIAGDSFTEGQGVEAEHTLARVLEELLEESGSPRSFQVVNCGRRGLDLPELMASFEGALVYEPDLIIYALTLNDAVRPPEFQARQAYINDWILDRERLPEEEVAPPSGQRSRTFDLVADRVSAWRVGKETTRWYIDMWGQGNPEGWARTQELMRDMSRRSNRQGARFLVAVWPLFVGLEGPYPFEGAHETLRRFCLQAGMPFLDLLSVFQGRDSARLWVHPVDRHPNEVAHRLAAESIAPVVLQLADAP